MLNFTELTLVLGTQKSSDLLGYGLGFGIPILVAVIAFSLFVHK